MDSSFGDPMGSSPVDSETKAKFQESLFMIADTAHLNDAQPVAADGVGLEQPSTPSSINLQLRQSPQPQVEGISNASSSPPESAAGSSQSGPTPTRTNRSDPADPQSPSPASSFASRASTAPPPPQFRDAPSQFGATPPRNESPPSGYVDTQQARKRREELITRLKAHVEKGRTPSNDVSYYMTAELSELELEVETLDVEQSIKDGVREWKQRYLGLAMMITIFNDAFNPIDVDLQDWLEEFTEKVNKMDDVFERLNAKWGRTSYSSPEMAAVMTMAWSLGQFTLGQIYRKNQTIKREEKKEARRLRAASKGGNNTQGQSPHPHHQATTPSHAAHYQQSHHWHNPAGHYATSPPTHSPQYAGYTVPPTYTTQTPMMQGLAQVAPPSPMVPQHIAQQHMAPGVPPQAQFVPQTPQSSIPTQAAIPPSPVQPQPQPQRQPQPQSQPQPQPQPQFQPQTPNTPTPGKKPRRVLKKLGDVTPSLPQPTSMVSASSSSMQAPGSSMFPVPVPNSSPAPQFQVPAAPSPARNARAAMSPARSPVQPPSPSPSLAVRTPGAPPQASPPVRPMMPRNVSDTPVSSAGSDISAAFY